MTVRSSISEQPFLHRRRVYRFRSALLVLSFQLRDAFNARTAACSIHPMPCDLVAGVAPHRNLNRVAAVVFRHHAQTFLAASRFATSAGRSNRCHARQN
jgi:hypothetical protein